MKPVSKMATDTDISAMESLALPAELYWDCKTEPESPLSMELFSMNEPAGFWLHDDDFENGIVTVSDDDFDLKPGMELLNGDDLVLEFSDLKEEEWSEDKVPLLDTDSIIAHPNSVTKVYSNFDNSDALKSENFEITVLTTLTPPQSPPQSSTSANILQHAIATEGVVNFNNYIHHHSTFHTTPATVSSAAPTPVATSTNHAVPSHALASATPTATLQNLHFTNYYGAAPFTPSEAPQTDDDKRNSQIVDDILKSFIKELPDLNDECESNSSSAYSTVSRPESIVTDEDWSPDSSFSSSASSSPIYGGGDEDNTQFVQSKQSEPKKRTRPYGRGVEDRKIRKKEQNKNAATRYRQKKKIEMENVLNEEQQLTQRNDELKRILAERQREAKYLKTLIREFYSQKKGSQSSKH